jgi:antirestriction protein ArdC
MKTINTTETTGLQTRIEHKVNIYEQITERICTMLENGVAPWSKPWKVTRGMPRNLVSKKFYRGINTFLLHALQYESPFWLTFKQATEAGGHIRRGEKACPVVFWKQVAIEDRETGEEVKVPFLRYYYVFNVSQVEGLKETPTIAPEPPTAPALIVEGYKNAPQIKGGMAAAYYDPSQDCVGMPDKARFNSEADYWGTLYHELTHSTGHKDRLNRLVPTTFGSEEYSAEELVAELGSAYLCGYAGVERTIETSASYLAGWLKALKSDTKLIVKAAAQAQKAADHIRGVTHEPPAE